MYKGFFEHSKEFKNICKSISDEDALYVYGMNSEYSSLMATAGAEKCLIVTHSDENAREIHDFLSIFNDKAMLLPSLEMEFFGVFARTQESQINRADIIGKLSGDGDFLIVSSIAALSRAIPERQKRVRTLRLEYGKNISMEESIKFLVSLGFERTEIVESKAQFSVRGGIIDLFPIDGLNPVRVEFYGDEIDSIREFDVTNQISIENVYGIDVLPAYESIIPFEEAKELSDKVRAVCAENEHYLSRKFVQELLELAQSLEDGVYTHDDIDRFSPLLYEKMTSFTEILPKDCTIALIDSDRITERAAETERDFTERLTNALEAGRALPDQERRLVNLNGIINGLRKRRVVVFDILKKSTSLINPSEIIRISTAKPSNYYSKLDILKEEVEKWKYRGFKIYICMGDLGKSKRLMDDMNEMNCNCNVIHDIGGDVKVLSGQCVVLPVDLKEGAVFPSFKTVFISERDIYGESRTYRPRKKASKERVINLFGELGAGDLIVHENHGIGRYTGLEQLSIDGAIKDFLKIRYAGDDVLYVQPENMDSIQKYIGNDEAVKLSKLGGTEWQRSKSKARKSVEDITDELIKLYAERENVRGYEFSTDTDWQRQFEEAFPFEETDDQLKCIEEIKKDMETPCVMDRLLCGDVGYGKTEVAMRAIFKAVSDSKQVAVLVPTTVLAQQHYVNMVDRFSKFPIKIEMLSRFRSKKRQNAIIRDTEAGIYDVIIGTHRLLSGDVVFKDLGLLIVDEEQRFGVKHKEALKKIKSGVDVLTMTATPIPRTLHMSLSGVRDMSVIEDPPADRYPIQTFVTEFDMEVINEAIMREVSRGGQVFFVHNRIKDIDSLEAELSKKLPDIRIEYAHGRMAETRLEKIMNDFMNGEFDVLVSTTIVETGLDISNANTIIINNADKMGLSQLYQLRGRVGRSGRTAYAYLMYTKDKMLSGVAEKRLHAIKEFTELGSGFRIAMRDMEIRGAGDLLGSQQHGHIASVGYELYCKMINEAVMVIKGEALPREVQDTVIEFSVDAFIPSDLIEVSEHKLDMYKRISAIKGRDDMDAIAEEMEDRYGSAPPSVLNLLEVSYLRRLGQMVGAVSIAGDSEGVLCRLSENANITAEGIDRLSKKYGIKFKFSAGKKPFLRLKISKNDMTGMEMLREATIMAEMLLI